MANRRVTILDPSGVKKYVVELPDDVEIEKILEHLIPKMKLPVIGPNGRIPYSLTRNEKGEDNENALDPNLTLADANTQEGDMFRLYAPMTGGALRGWCPGNVSISQL